MDLQEAYKVLGVSENATHDEIEKKYLTWIKRANASQRQPKSERYFDMELITDAYNVINAYKEYGSKSPQEFDSFREKLDHFFRYYKLHMIGIITFIVICVSITQSVMGNLQEQKALANLPPENLSIMLYGDYFNPESNTTPVSENVLNEFPSWERVTVKLNYTPLEINNTVDIGYQQKSTASLVTDRPDLYIMNKELFKRHVDDGMFHPLDKLESFFQESLESDKLYYAKTTESKTEHLYGVAVSDTNLFDGIKVSNDEKVVAIRVGAKNKENAMEFILELMK